MTTDRCRAAVRPYTYREQAIVLRIGQQADRQRSALARFRQKPQFGHFFHKKRLGARLPVPKTPRQPTPAEKGSKVYGTEKVNNPAASPPAAFY